MLKSSEMTNCAVARTSRGSPRRWRGGAVGDFSADISGQSPLRSTMRCAVDPLFTCTAATGDRSGSDSEHVLLTEFVGLGLWTTRLERGSSWIVAHSVRCDKPSPLVFGLAQIPVAGLARVYDETVWEVGHPGVIPCRRREPSSR